MNLNLQLSDTVRASLQNQFGKSFLLQPLQEEASSRRYFSFNYNDKQHVLCVDNSINDDFVNLSSFLLDKGIRVPQVIQINEPDGWMLLSWEGKSDLSTLNLENYKKRLPEVLNLLLKFQTIEPPNFVKTRKFDSEKLSFEIQFTKEKYSIFQTMLQLDSTITNEMDAFLDETIGFLDKHPINVFTHRDFHSRNILINDAGGLTLIDFQDARMGVPQYDLASIIYDAYYPLPTQFRKEMIEYFQKKSIGGNFKFKETFYLQSLQRSLKALGTYFRLVAEEKKDKFKPSILSCLEQLEEIVQIGLFADSLYIFIRSLRNELSKHPEFKK